MKHKLLAAGTAVIVLSSAYAFWQNEKRPLPVVTDRETNQSANTADNLPEAPLSANQKSRVVAGVSKLKSSDHSSDSLPESVEDSSRNWPDTVRLWQTVENDPSTTVDGVPATRLQVDPKRLRQLHVGQTLTLDIPHEGTAFEAKITSTHNDPAGVSTLIDEGEINARQAPFDDGIAVGPPEESTLPPIN